MDSILSNSNADLDFIENDLLNGKETALKPEDAAISGIEITLSRGLTNLRSLVDQYKAQIERMKLELELEKESNKGNSEALVHLRKNFDTQINEFIAYSFELEQKIGFLNRELKTSIENSEVERSRAASEMQKLMNDLNQANESLSETEQKLVQATASFDSRLREMTLLGLELEADIKKLQKDLSQAKSEIDKRDETIREMKASADFSEKQHKSEITSLQKIMKNRERELALLVSEKENLIKEYDSKIAEMQESFENRMASMAGTHYELEAKNLRVDLTRLRKKAESVEKELNQRLEKAIKSQTEAEINARQKERDFQNIAQSYEQEKEKSSHLEKELFEVSTKFNSTNESLKSKDARIEKLQKEIVQYQTRIQQNEMAIQSLNETVELLNLEIQKMQASKIELHRVPFLQKEIKSKDEEIISLKEELVAVQAAYDAIRNEKDGDRSTTQQMISNLQAEVHRLSIELGVAQQLAKSGEARHSVEMKEIQDTRQKLEKREAQLQSYAMILAKEKETLAKNADHLAAELRNAQALHPLRDYLELTERELMRLDIQLKKTPVASPDRAQLEAFVDQLIEQKKFLETVIEASHQSLVEQAGTLKGMTAVENTKTTGVPSLPPRADQD